MAGSKRGRKDEARSRGELIGGARAGSLVGPPAQEAGSVAEAPAGEAIVLDLDDQPGRERHPLARALRAPAAWTAGRRAGEAGRPDERPQPGEQRLAIRRLEARGESHVVQQPLAIVEPQQQRADHACPRGVAKASHHAIGGAQALHLLHALAVVRMVRLAG